MDDIDKTMPGHREFDGGDRSINTNPGAQVRIPNGWFRTGDLIMGRYEVLAELGQGGMGVVYKCFDKTAGIEIALKALPPELSHNTLEMEDIKDNFQLVHNLHHPNIASSNNLEKDPANGNYYLIMECVNGEDLRRWIKRKRKENALNLNAVLPVIRQVADALDYAHEQKIIHRDIKPGNIMIDAEGNVKVLDFGLAAQIHTSMTRVSMAYHGTSGTGPYMAPEQWRGKAQGAAADQYALAVMTYEMLAGRLPFESSDAAILKQAILDEFADDIPGLSSSIQLALRKAMSKDPAERFESCNDFIAALNGKKFKTTGKKGNKKPMFLRVAALLLLIAGAGYGYSYYHARRTVIGINLAQEKRIAEEAAKKAEADRIAKEEAAKKAEADRIAKEEAAKKTEADRIAKEEAAKKAEEAKIAAAAKRLDDAKKQATADAENIGIIFSQDFSELITFPKESATYSYTIPACVTKIGDSAFQNCNNLSYITIPDGLTYIGNSAFQNCNNLKSITIPDGLTYIGNSAFQDCNKLSSITIPDGLTYIGNFAFANCEHLRKVTIPDSLSEIKEGTFYRVPIISFLLGQNSHFCLDRGVLLNREKTRVIKALKNITAYTIPNTVVSLDPGAFFGCSNLQSVTIPNGVTSIGDSAFRGCSNLQSVTIPNGVTSIGKNMFNGCSNLQSVTIPDGITAIKKRTFAGCHSLRTIEIPNSVKSIESSAFECCENLTSITIPDSVTSIGDSTFSSCSNLQSVTIPGSVTSIGNRAFGYCTNLQSITIPGSVISIGDNAFDHCTNLQSVTIQNGVTSIGEFAFYWCTKLQSITIPDSVTSIGMYAFGSCPCEGYVRKN